MKKKQYLKPIVLFEDMDISDCILGLSKTEITSAASDVTIDQSNNPQIATNGVSKPESIASKESDWSYDYTFDLDW